jgi:hypothetical protein
MCQNLRSLYNVVWITRASNCGSLHLRPNLPEVFVSFPGQAKTKSELRDPTDCSVWCWERPLCSCVRCTSPYCSRTTFRLLCPLIHCAHIPDS